MTGHTDIVFDGPPSHESGRFVEVEDETGRSIRYGNWVEREDGFWALRVEKPTFRRVINFEKGYNYLHETGPRRRGQHGMGIRFLLVGPHGAAQFLMNTSWTPLGEVDEDKTYENGYHREPVHCDTWETSNFGLGATKFGKVNPPSGFDLGYHWLTPQYEGQEEYARPCQYLDGRLCYYDGSGLQADVVLREFIECGESAIWKRLVERYRWCLEGAKEYADARTADIDG